jgi:hypothetical protein
MVMEHVQYFTKADLAKFTNDKSGRFKLPAKGARQAPGEQRYWARSHSIYHEYLSRTHPSSSLAVTYNTFLRAKLEEQPIDEWQEVRLYDYLKRNMAEAATISLAGKRLLEMNPDFIDALWAFDEIILQLVWGLPAWMNSKAVRVRERYNKMGQKFLEDAFQAFSSTSGDTDVDWEPIFGSRFSREQAKWARDSGLSLQARAGLYVFNIFG